MAGHQSCGHRCGRCDSGGSGLIGIAAVIFASGGVLSSGVFGRGGSSIGLLSGCIRDGRRVFVVRHDWRSVNRKVIID